MKASHFLVILLAIDCFSCAHHGFNKRTKLYISKNIALSKATNYLLFTPIIDMRTCAMEGNNVPREDTTRAISLRKKLMETLPVVFAKQSIGLTNYFNQNIHFRNELEGFMQKAMQKKLDTVYLQKKEFPNLYLKQNTILFYLTHVYCWQQRVGQAYNLYLQCLLIDSNNRIIYYNYNRLRHTGGDGLNAELPQQLDLLLKPLFEELSKQNKSGFQKNK